MNRHIISMKTRGVPQISQDIMEKYNGFSVPSVHCISLNEMPIAWVFDRLARIGWVFIGLWICVKPLGMFLLPTPTPQCATSTDTSPICPYSRPTPTFTSSTWDSTWNGSCAITTSPSSSPTPACWCPKPCGRHAIGRGKRKQQYFCEGKGKGERFRRSSILCYSDCYCPHVIRNQLFGLQRTRNAR